MQEQQDGSGGYASSLQTQQPYGAPPCFDAGPYELISLGMRARTAGWLSYLYYKLPVIGDYADKLIDRIHL